MEKNLHASLPPLLLTQKMERAADAEHITLDEWLEKAAKTRLNLQEWQDVYCSGNIMPKL